MPKAITVKIIPQTETKPRRIKAFDLDNNNVVLSYGVAEHKAEDHMPLPCNGHKGDATYYAAAYALCRKMKWSGDMIGGHVKHGMVFVFTNK